MTTKEKKREKKKSSNKRLRSDSVVLSDNDQPLNNSKERGMDVGTINMEGDVPVTGKKLMVVDDKDTTDKKRIEKREKKKSKSPRRKDSTMQIRHRRQIIMLTLVSKKAT